MSSLFKTVYVRVTVLPMTLLHSRSPQHQFAPNQIAICSHVNLEQFDMGRISFGRVDYVV